MICSMCVAGRESECLGKTKHKTWCDWQGFPHDTVILQAQFCKHLRATEDYCPTCGSNLAQDRDDGNGPIYDISPGAFIEPVEYDQETQRDIEDNFVPTVRDIKFTETHIEDGAIETAELKPAKRGIIPRRSKETPSS